MYKTLKRLCLIVFIITAALLIRTLPDSIVIWIDQHYPLVWAVYMLAGLGYCECDRHTD